MIMSKNFGLFITYSFKRLYSTHMMESTLVQSTIRVFLGGGGGVTPIDWDMDVPFFEGPFWQKNKFLCLFYSF